MSRDVDQHAIDEIRKYLAKFQDAILAAEKLGLSIRVEGKGYPGALGRTCCRPESLTVTGSRHYP